MSLLCRRSSVALFCLFFVALSSVRAFAASRYTMVPLKEIAPKEEVSKEVAATLEPVAMRILDRKKKPFADIWLRRRLEPQKAKNEPGVAYGHIPAGSVLGVIRVHKRGSDFRGDRFKPGVFTMRFGVLPQDGDHLGVAESRDFVILAPAKLDTKLARLSEKESVKLSTKASGSKHPAILYLIKLYDKPKKLPRVVEEEDLEFWILDCEIRNAPLKQAKGKDATKDKPEKASAAFHPIRLSLVIEGESEEA